MSHLKLMKLLYLADRRSLISRGRPITFDWYYSMPQGPVLSFTLNKMNEQTDETNLCYWHRYISEITDNEVRLLTDDILSDQLSEAEEDLIDQVFAEHGHKSRWELRDYCHKELPEWQDPKGSSLPIQIETILRTEGFSDPEIDEVLDTLAAEETARDLLG